MDLPSLYSYLNPEGINFCLRFSLISEEQSVLEKAYYPFLLISDSDPLTRMVEAKFVTDNGSNIKKVFLLIQRDQYLIVKDELRPITNKNIYEFWQRAYSFYINKKDYYSFITLASQIDQTGGLIPFNSLFFCKKIRTFFHPPCPECGLPLEQCYDDNILNNSGLLAYSTSLKRYLYCPSCFSAKGKSCFYVYDLEGSDPPTLKNRWDLIKDFGSLLEKRKGIEREDQIKGFPCLNCPYNNNCYGTREEASSKIAPFSFYPFYMFIFDSMSLNAIDFLALVSGASFEELQIGLYKKQELGRIQCLKKIKQDCEDNCPQKVFFPIKKDEKSFLEVLYLKLSFLGELIRDIFSSGADALKYPDMGLSLEHIWVKLPVLHGLLPLFWDFSIKHIDIMKRIDIMRDSDHILPFVNIHQSNSFYFLSLVWFYTLLVNKEQGMVKINLSLGKLLKTRDITDLPPFSKINRVCSVQTFLVENIFWDPVDRAVPETWHIFWERALSLGWALLNASLNPAHNWGKEEFCQKFDSLRDEVKNNLFQGKPGHIEKAHSIETMEERKILPEELIENEAIHNILMKIHDKWYKDIKVQTPLSETKESGREEEPGETVIISPEAFREERQRPESSKDFTEEKNLEETIIISPKGQRGPREKTEKSNLERPTKGPEDRTTKESKELEKTIVISSGKDLHDSSESSQDHRARHEHPAKDKDTLKGKTSLQETTKPPQETAGLSQEDIDSWQDAGYSSRKAAKSQGAANSSQEAPGSSKEFPGPSKEAPDSKKDDFFTETIILTPEQIKDKLNKRKKENNE